MPGRATLWFAFLGGPVAWSAHLLASYPLVPLACESGSTLALNLVTFVTLLAAAASAAAGALALRKVRALSEGAAAGGAAAATAGAVEAEAAPGDVPGGTPAPGGPSDATPEGTALDRARFMARYGLWSGVFFTFVIAVEGLPPLLQNPCLGIG